MPELFDRRKKQALPCQRLAGEFIENPCARKAGQITLQTAVGIVTIWKQRKKDEGRRFPGTGRTQKAKSDEQGTLSAKIWRSQSSRRRALLRRMRENVIGRKQFPFFFLT